MWHTCLALSEPHGTPKGSQESARSWGFLSCQKQWRSPVLEAGQDGGEPLQGHLHAASAVRSAGIPRVLLFGSPHRPPIGTLSSQTGQLNF